MAGRILTGNEFLIMEEFWKGDGPLTSVDLMERMRDKDWHASYLVAALRRLEEKGFIQMCGTIRHSTQYARQFVPVISREEYAGRLALSSGIGQAAIADVTLAMVQGFAGEDPEEFDAILEEALDELKKRKQV